MNRGVSTEIYQGDGRDWDAFVSAQPGATNYHQYGWKQVVEESFGHKGYYLAARNEAGELAGVLPVIHMKSRLFGSFLVSVPFFNYGGMLCGDPGAVSPLLERAAGLLAETRASHLELRHLGGALAGLRTKSHKVTMLLDLARDADTQWAGFNAKLRNQIRKAEKSGLTAASGGRELLADFYAVFARNMRDLGTPVYARGFFSRVLTRFAGQSRLIVVYLARKPVAAGLIVRYRDSVEIPWASSIRDFNTLCPNNLLYWSALRHAIETGASRFDFGRSTRGEGTYRFKEQWGAKPVELSWQYLLPEGSALPELNNKNPKFEMAIRIWQKLPVGLTRVLGPHIVKNIP